MRCSILAARWLLLSPSPRTSKLSLCLSGRVVERGADLCGQRSRIGAVVVVVVGVTASKGRPPAAAFVIIAFLVLSFLCGLLVLRWR